MNKDIKELKNKANQLYNLAVSYNCDHASNISIPHLMGMIEDMTDLINEIAEKVEEIEKRVELAENIAMVAHSRSSDT